MSDVEEHAGISTICTCLSETIIYSNLYLCVRMNLSIIKMCGRMYIFIGMREKRGECVGVTMIKNLVVLYT